MYAVRGASYRAIESADDLAEGETAYAEIPESVMQAARVAEGRLRRDGLLRDTDWTQIADNSLTTLQRSAYSAYRQTLRALPETPGFPDVSWPQEPKISGASNEGGQQS